MIYQKPRVITWGKKDNTFKIKKRWQRNEYTKSFSRLTLRKGRERIRLRTKCWFVFSGMWQAMFHDHQLHSTHFPTSTSGFLGNRDCSLAWNFEQTSKNNSQPLIWGSVSQTLSHHAFFSWFIIIFFTKKSCVRPSREDFKQPHKQNAPEVTKSNQSCQLSIRSWSGNVLKGNYQTW